MKLKPRIPLFLIGLQGLLYIAMIGLPESRVIADGDALFVTINPYRGQLYVLLLSASLVTLVFWFGIRKTRTKTSSVLVAVVALSPFVCCYGILGDVISFVDVASVRDRDGTEFHFLAEHFLQGSELMIGRLESHTILQDRFRVVVTSGWEEDGGYLSVVRPEGTYADKQLFLTRNRVLVGIPYENMAFLAYDLAKGKAYSEVTNVGPPKSSGPMKELSPFLLLGPHDTPRESDFKVLQKVASNGRPDFDVVRRDQSNPNPKVRLLVHRLLGNAP